MQKYIIDISRQAERDFTNIIKYIKNELLEPAIATKYSKLIKEKIDSLEYSPERFGIIDNELIKNKEHRKLVIKNYIAFYRIDNEKNIVHIIRVFHGSRDWQNML